MVPFLGLDGSGELIRMCPGTWNRSFGPILHQFRILSVAARRYTVRTDLFVFFIGGIEHSGIFSAKSFSHRIRTC